MGVKCQNKTIPTILDGTYLILLFTRSRKSNSTASVNRVDDWVDERGRTSPFEEHSNLCRPLQTRNTNYTGDKQRPSEAGEKHTSICWDKQSDGAAPLPVAGVRPNSPPVKSRLISWRTLQLQIILPKLINFLFYEFFIIKIIPIICIG